MSAVYVFEVFHAKYLQPRALSQQDDTRKCITRAVMQTMQTLQCFQI